MLDLDSIDASPEAKAEGDRLLAEYGRDSTVYRLVQMIDTTATDTIAAIRAAQFAKDQNGDVIAGIDPAPYKALRLRTPVQSLAEAIEAILQTSVTPKQAREVVKAIEAAGFSIGRP